MNTDLHFSTGNDETGTDPELYFALDAEFGFVADMAALSSNTKHWNWYGPDHEDPSRRNALQVDWPTDGPVFVNPPYSRESCGLFISKAKLQSGLGVTSVMLLAARTDTRWFHDHLYDKETWRPRNGVTLRFLSGRVKFEGHKNSAPFPSMVAIIKPGL